ncbi:dienelactone hydrolase [Pleurocapsa sp. CCALA 161]|nr:dienelactone hydrolase [Pleurocapsa sp. CCALA 161]
MYYDRMPSKKFPFFVHFCRLFLWLSILPFWLKVKPSLAAEKITTFIGPLQISIAVDSIETFADKGKIESDLGLIVNRLDEPARAKLRELLQQRFDNISPDFISRYSRLTIAEGILHQIGKIVQPQPGINGILAMRSATILAAADKKEGLTIINVLRRFPSQNIYLDSDSLLELGLNLRSMTKYKKAAVAEVIRQSNIEASTSQVNSDETPRRFTAQGNAHQESDRLPDLSQPGTFEVQKKAMSFKIDRPRTKDIVSVPYNLNFELYEPQGISKPAPLIFITQGFGATPDTYGYIAQQLASYGYVVASIEHRGTNLAKRLEYPNTELTSWITPSEFVSRPLDVTHLLDKFEDLVANNRAWTNRLDLDRVGVFGYSFGGYSALAIAGAEINFPRLEEECSTEGLNPVVSFTFQCQAKYLAPHSGKLKDPRIKAVFSVYPLTNPIFGKEGMSQIDIPTAIIAGGKDNVSPPVQNQIHPWLWLKTPDKYLALISQGGHLTTVKPKDRGIEGIPQVEETPKTDPQGDIAINYLKSLSVAFFNRHLQGLEEYEPYLTADYAKSISQENLNIYLTQSLQPEQLAAAYGKNPPIPLNPKPIASAKPSKEESILAEIGRTGILKVALRSDAAPISALNENYNWTGYCARTINTLEDYLEIKLDRPHGIQVVKLPSDSENSDRMINEDRAHLGCGSNPIDSDTERVSACDLDSACNYNGMILPAGDRSWQETIDNFFSSKHRQQ